MTSRERRTNGDGASAGIRSRYGVLATGRLGFGLCDDCTRQRLLLPQSGDQHASHNARVQTPGCCPGGKAPDCAATVRPRREQQFGRCISHFRVVNASPICRARLTSSLCRYIEVVDTETITLDGYAASHRAVREMKADGLLPEDTKVRSSKYLNTVIEQDHRHIKSRTNVMLGFKRFRSAATTISGIELTHRIRKGQFDLAELGLKDAAAPAIWNAVLSTR
jgi:hypothetical protein